MSKQRGNMTSNFGNGTPQSMAKAMYEGVDNPFGDVPDIVDEVALQQAIDEQQQIIHGLADELEVAQENQQWYQINGASIEFLIADPTDEQCYKLIDDLLIVEDAIHFIIGDIIAFKTLHGDKGKFVAELAKRTGKSEATYNLYSSLSNRIPPSYRYPSELVGIAAYKKIADKCGKEDSLYDIDVAIETYKALNEDGKKPSSSDWGHYLENGKFPPKDNPSKKPSAYLRNVERVASKTKPSKEEVTEALADLHEIEQWLKVQRKILGKYRF